ncbi:hypothetical protein HUJ04_004252 [Dendroctonus ponderosae]|nr:hypothetical protein HUJ04_004252 [Dendroctonus ponderosae]
MLKWVQRQSFKRQSNRTKDGVLSKIEKNRDHFLDFIELSRKNCLSCGSVRHAPYSLLALEDRYFRISLSQWEIVKTIFISTMKPHSIVKSYLVGKTERLGSDPRIATCRGKLQNRRSKLNQEINKELRLRAGAENLFKATTNKKLKETVAVELSFVNSNLQLLKEQLAELNSSVELYQGERNSQRNEQVRDETKTTMPQANSNLTQIESNELKNREFFPSDRI